MTLFKGGVTKQIKKNNTYFYSAMAPGDSVQRRCYKASKENYNYNKTISIAPWLQVTLFKGGVNKNNNNNNSNNKKRIRKKNTKKDKIINKKGN